MPGNSFQVFIQRFSAYLPFSLDTGSYRVNLVTGVRSVEKGPFFINRPVLTGVIIYDAPGEIFNMLVSDKNGGFLIAWEPQAGAEIRIVE